MSMEHLIADWGLPALTLGTFFEGDAVAFIGGVMAHRGLMSVFGAWAAVCLGAMFVDNTLFQLGRHGARLRPVRRLLENPVAGRITQAVGAHPIKIALGFRFVWGTRTFTPPVMGAAGVSPWLFVLCDTVAVMLWSALFVALGFGLGLTAERLWGRLGWGGHAALAALGGVVLAAGAFVLWQRRRRGRGG